MQSAPGLYRHLLTCGNFQFARPAGIPSMGYNFSIAGVCGRTTSPYARSRAMSVGMEGPLDAPTSNGLVWSTIYDTHAAKRLVPPCKVRSLDATQTEQTISRVFFAVYFQSSGHKRLGERPNRNVVAILACKQVRR